MSNSLAREMLLHFAGSYRAKAIAFAESFNRINAFHEQHNFLKTWLGPAFARQIELDL
jgi:hypothetical protein